MSSTNRAQLDLSENGRPTPKTRPFLSGNRPNALVSRVFRQRNRSTASKGAAAHEQWRNVLTPTTGERPWVSARLQLRGGAGFPELLDSHVLETLGDMGVTVVYLSPILNAQKGSDHNYDVTDAEEINPALGGREGFERFARRANELGLSVLVDEVPNHQAMSTQNRILWDVLKRGRDSKYANHFAIRWHEADNRIVLPMLGDSLETVITQGHIKIEYATPEWGGEMQWVLNVYNNRYPLNPDTLPPDIATTHAEMNGDKQRLGTLLEQQRYVLRHWTEPANFERFFNYNHLIKQNVTDPQVFARTHDLLLDLFRQQLFQHFRVDHPAGITDSPQYLRMLRHAMGNNGLIFVEEILQSEYGQELSTFYENVAGTTGYPLLNAIRRSVVSHTGYQALRDYVRTHGEPLVGNMNAAIVQAKDEVCRDAGVMKPEVTALAFQLATLAGVEEAVAFEALVAILRNFPVYRTYAHEKDGMWNVSLLDEQRLQLALGAVDNELAQTYESPEGSHPRPKQLFGSATREQIEAALLPFREIAILSGSDGAKRELVTFIKAFQSSTGPILAKGIEDRALFRLLVLYSLNEVAGNPSFEGQSVEQLHRLNEQIVANRPHEMSARSTHDTKVEWSAAVRSSAIAERPIAYIRMLEYIEHVIGANKLPTVDDGSGTHIPDRYMLHQLVQSMVMTMPVLRDGESAAQFSNRMINWPSRLIGAPGTMQDGDNKAIGHLLRSARQDGRYTSWRDKNVTYEEGWASYVKQVFQNEALIASFYEYMRAQVLPIARRIATKTAAMHVLGPGSLDYYQSDDVRAPALGDPDNREFVDWTRRRDATQHIHAVLHEQATAPPRRATIAMRDPEVVEQRLLQIRQGGYAPCFVPGAQYERVLMPRQNQVAFRRIAADGSREVTVITGENTPSRGLGHRAQSFGACLLQAGTYTNLITGQELHIRAKGRKHTHSAAAPLVLVKLGDLLGDSPVAVLGRGGAAHTFGKYGVAPLYEAQKEQTVQLAIVEPQQTDATIAQNAIGIT